MTIPEIKGFIKVIGKKEAETQIQFITGVCLGSNGDSKSIKRVIKELQDTVRETESD